MQMQIDYDDVKKIKMKDFVKAFKEVYEEVKGEKVENNKDNKTKQKTADDYYKEIIDVPIIPKSIGELEKNYEGIKTYLLRSRNRKDESVIADFTQKLKFMSNFLAMNDHQFKTYGERQDAINRMEAIDKFTEIINSQKEQIKKLEEGDVKKYIINIIDKIEELGKKKKRIRLKK